MPRWAEFAGAEGAALPERRFLAEGGDLRRHLRRHPARCPCCLLLEKEPKVSSFGGFGGDGRRHRGADATRPCPLAVPRLEYKYSKLVMNAAAKESELPAPDSCAIMEGEDAEDDLLFATKKSLFGKIKSLTSKVRAGGGRTQSGRSHPGGLWLLRASVSPPGGWGGLADPALTAANVGRFRLRPTEDIVRQHRHGAVTGRGGHPRPPTPPQRGLRDPLRTGASLRLLYVFPRVSPPQPSAKKCQIQVWGLYNGSVSCRGVVSVGGGVVHVHRCST